MHLLTLTTHLVENIYFKNKKSKENGYISQCAKYQMLQQTLFTIEQCVLHCKNIEHQRVNSG